MSFAQQRQAALRAGPLNLELFGEEVTVTIRGSAAKPVRVKIEHRQFTSSNPNRLGGNAAPRQNPTVDEMEQIVVCVSRDPTWNLSLPTKPDPGDTLLRDAARDADRRPYAFTGEVIFEGDQHANYVFQRPRRFIQGRMH